MKTQIPQHQSGQQNAQKTLMKSHISALVGLMVLFGPINNAVAQDAPALAEGIIARVNANMITSYDLNQRVTLLMALSDIQVNAESYPLLQKQALESLQDEALILQEMKKYKVDVSDKEIEQTIAKMANGYGRTTEAFLAELKKSNIERPTLDNQIKAQTGGERLINGLFGRSARVGRDQVEAKLDQLIADSQKPQFQVAEIYLDFDKVGSRENAINGAGKLYEQIASKQAPFQLVARQFSQAATSKQGGVGDPWISGSMDPILEDALISMQPGQLSPPIETGTGVYILYLINKSNEPADLVYRITEARINDAPEDKRTEEQLLIALKKHGCSAERNIKDDKALITGLGDVALSDLKSDYSDPLRSLKSGQFTSVKREGNAIRALMVCDRKIAGANQVSRQEIEQFLVNQRLDMLGRRYIRDLRSSSTIESIL
jgi:peptidyl-prolyl cis-trans isomerase SurA